MSTSKVTKCIVPKHIHRSYPNQPNEIKNKEAASHGIE